MATTKNKPAAKAAPAPAPVEEATADIGSLIVFTGYGADVPDDQRSLVEGEQYTVVAITEAEGDDPGGDICVAIDNPDFNPKKKETDENPKTIAVVVMPDEYELAQEVEEAEEAAPAPAKAPVATKAVGKAATKTTGKPAAKTAPAPVEEPPAEEAAADELPDLDGEDEEVLALVNGEDDLITVAQGLEATAATSEYRLGGILYHIKKTKAYLEVENGVELYGPEVKGGFGIFLKDYFNVEYRKAMYLIDIYIAFTQAGIPNAADKVAEIGWAKASRIARPMMVEGSKPEDLIELASNNTLADLSDAVKEQTRVGGTEGTPVQRVTLRFRYLSADGENLLKVLEAVKETQGLVDIGAALQYIVDDWTSHNAPDLAPTKAAPAQTKAVGKAVGKPAAKAAPAAKPAAKRVASKA